MDGLLAENIALVIVHLAPENTSETASVAVVAPKFTYRPGNGTGGGNVMTLPKEVRAVVKGGSSKYIYDGPKSTMDNKRSFSDHTEITYPRFYRRRERT